MAILGQTVVNALLLGPGADGRLVHDSPIRGDVWAALGAKPGERTDLLIEAYREVPTGSVAARLADRLYGKWPLPDREPFNAGEQPTSFGISYVEGFVAARANLVEIAFHILPYTAWVADLRLPEDFDWAPALGAVIKDQLSEMIQPGQRSERLTDTPPFLARLAPTFRILAGLWLALNDPDGDEVLTFADFAKRYMPHRVGETATTFAKDVIRLRPQLDKAMAGDDRSSDIFAVSRNRPVELAIERSIPAIKADAVSTLFAVSCERIGWAVLDTGIDATHPAFKNFKKGGNRVVSTYDFTRLRQVVLIDHIYNKKLRATNAQSLAALVPAKTFAAIDAELLKLANDARAQRPIDWAIAEQYIVVAAPERPRNPHGTHVAGILGGCWAEDDFPPAAPPIAKRGVCPDIRLFDFRVVSGSDEDSEFALVGALQFIRYLNSRNNRLQIHGANISLSIRHDVRNYACGRTPVCEEAERLVSSGVVVVAAAGNRGYQSYTLSGGGAFETYAPSSITDPGNAEAVITVGATHRSSPHSYGVSFFSSRGPTGDGRAKPDLVAPGEKIWSVVPGGTEDAFSGTSMASPHVSGAAAMLMARNGEFVGQSARIKQILCASCTDLGRERSFQGAGMLDILRAMQSV